MKLSDGERLLVVMLAEVMEELKLNREIDPALVRKLAIYHDDWAIAQKYHGIYDSESPSDADVKETHDILSMWSFIEYSIGELQGEEAKEAAGFHHTQFSGFDGNNDPHHGIAQTLIKDLGLYSEFASRGLNSHSRATLARYRTMLPKFDKAMEGATGEPLPINVLRDLLN